MNSLSQYIIEKFKISKNISSFDEEAFEKMLERYKLSPTMAFGQKLKEWCEKYNVSDIDIYGWPGINHLMDVKDEYIEDDKERRRLTDILIKTGTMLNIDTTKYPDAKDKNFYYTDTLFCMLSNDNNWGIVVKEKNK